MVILTADGHAQVSVETAIAWLVAIAGGTAVQKPMQQSEPAAAAALDALHVLFRDDAAHWCILSAQNVAGVQRLRACMQDRGAAGGCAAAEVSRCALVCYCWEAFEEVAGDAICEDGCSIEGMVPLQAPGSCAGAAGQDQLWAGPPATGCRGCCTSACVRPLVKPFCSEQRGS
jgi:hypothetical protein